LKRIGSISAGVAARAASAHARRYVDGARRFAVQAEPGDKRAADAKAKRSFAIQGVTLATAATRRLCLVGATGRNASSSRSVWNNRNVPVREMKFEAAPKSSRGVSEVEPAFERDRSD
jgi:hypothetical protein